MSRTPRNMSVGSMELENSSSGNSAVPVPEDDFYSAAASRIPRFMIGLGLVLTPAAGWKFGSASALGFFSGSVIAFLNFHWLKAGVVGLADRVTNSGKSQSGVGIVVRF